MMNNKINFTDMVHSILGESCLSRSIKKVLTESSLSRLLSHRTNYDTGCITAFRYNIPKKKALELNAQLEKELQSMGYGTVHVTGFYKEQEMEKASKEQSLFVFDKEKTGNLHQDLMNLGRKYGQESILFKPKDGEARLIRTDEKAFGRESNPAEGTEWGKHSSAAWTELNGREFGDKINTDASYWENEETPEEPLPKITVQGSEILYNKRGRACGIKIQVSDQGTVYMKRRGSKWEITDISQQTDDQRVWDVVKSSLEKMAKKNPTTFIRLMRNRAYELPKFKPTTLGESVTVRGLEVGVDDIQRRTSGLTVAQIQQWLDAHDNTEFASMPDIVYSIENGESKEQMMGRAFGKVKTTVYSWLNLTEENPQVDDIIMKHLQTSKFIPTTNKSVREFIDKFWADELKQFQQPKIIPQEQSK
jgi:hypothetical protein